MTYQLLNENYVPARNLKNTNIRNVFFFFLFIFDISVNIGIYKIVPRASCLATLYPELPLIVWFTLNRIFTHSSSTLSTVLAFCAGVTRIYSGKVLVDRKSTRLNSSHT